MSGLDRGTVGLALGADPGDRALDLCRAMSGRVLLVDAGDLPGGRGPLLRRVGDPSPVRGDPTVLWVDQPSEVSGHVAAVREAVLVVSGDETALTAAVELGVPVRLVPAGTPWPDAVPVAPFVRARVRAARGVAEPALLLERTGRWTMSGVGDVPAAAVESALALAAAAAVGCPDALLGALAWGCPAVTDQATAAAVGAEHDVHCLVVGTSEAAQDQVVAIASDDALAARLSWAGRRLVEERHSLRTAADDVLAALRVPGRFAPSSLERELERLDSRRGPLRWAREEAAVTGIVPGPPRRRTA